MNLMKSLPQSASRKSSWRIALAAGLLINCALGVSVHSTAFAQEAPKVSKAVAKPLKAAQDAMQAKRYQEALAKLREKALAEKK